MAGTAVVVCRTGCVGAARAGIGSRGPFVGMLDNPEDAGTLAYMADTAIQAGAATMLIAMDTIGRNAKGGFVDPDDAPIEIAFKLYPWEWMFREQFGASLPGASTRWIQPPWKAILSSKGILPPLVGDVPPPPEPAAGLFRGRPRAHSARRFLCDEAAPFAGGRQCGIVIGGNVVDADSRPYGDEPKIVQAAAPLPVFDGNYAVLGSWIRPVSQRAFRYAKMPDRSPGIHRDSCRMRSSHEGPVQPRRSRST